MLPEGLSGHTLGIKKWLDKGSILGRICAGFPRKPEMMVRDAATEKDLWFHWSLMMCISGR